MSGSKIVVVGAGTAGVQAVQTLRVRGHDGSIALVSAEDEEPYNLPPLSKEFLTGVLDEDDIKLHSFSDFEDLGVDLVCGSAATTLDTTSRILKTTRGAVPYDKLIIATGSAPIFPDGWPALDGVVCLRTLADARSIRAAMTEGSPRVAIIGGGFIGCEVACSARSYGLDTTIIEGTQHILSRALRPELAQPVVRQHAEHGVRVQCGKSVRTLHGKGRVEAVELEDGTRVQADLVIVGIGARPVIDWLAGSGVNITDGVVVDPTLQSSVPGVYAVGDVARWPSGAGENIRVEHWTNAKEQGALAARNLLDPASAERFGSVPYVWSDLYGQRLQVAGDTQVGDLRFVIGEPGSDEYLAAVVKEERVIGGVGLAVGKAFSKLRRLIARHASWTDANAEFSVVPGSR